jgi:hypothetical protein
MQVGGKKEKVDTGVEGDRDRLSLVRNADANGTDR